MDPFSAISLATNICQFIDFGSKLLSGSLELYRSVDGTLSTNRVLENITKDLENLCTELEQGQSGIDAGSMSKSEVALVPLARSCGDLAHEFLAVLEGLKVKGRLPIVKSAWVPVKSAFKANKLRGYENTLGSYRSQIVTRLLKILTEKRYVGNRDMSKLEFEQSRIAAAVDALVESQKRLEMTITNEPAQLTTRIVESLEQIRAERRKAQIEMRKQKVAKKTVEECEQAEQKFVDQVTFDNPVVGQAILQEPSAEQNDYETKTENSSAEQRLATPESEEGDAKSHPQLPAKLSIWLSNLVTKGKTLRKQLEIIESLRFQAIVERESNIKEAHPATFEWLFEENPTEVEPATPNTFLRWLKCQGGIYWVSGKAGSGKSTLMKFLYNHEKTSTALRAWAGDKKLLTSSYFFWHAGTGMQKSQRGLLQTLLFNVLKQCPTLTPAVLPLRWSKSDAAEEGWSRAELLIAFKALREQPLDSTRFCFFIDGLDEYDGDHMEIIEIMNSFTSSSAIKVCFSSRPWVVFEFAFGENEGLRIKLHDLTRADIEKFVTEKLAEGPRFRRLMQESSEHRELIDEIVTRANGVFLWVFLVIQSLRRGMTNRDTIPELLERIRILPVELEEFFQLILDSAEKVYHKQAARLYQLRVFEPGTLTLMDVSYFNEEDPAFALQYRVPSWQKTGLHDRCVETRTRVAARCTDLLEFTHDDRVQFLHRTVQDFLETKDMQCLLSERAGKDFDAHVYLCNTALVQTKIMVQKPRDVKPWQELDVLLENFMFHACRLESQSRLDCRLLTEMEQTIVPLRKKANGNRGCECSNLGHFALVPRFKNDHLDGWLGDMALEKGVHGYQAIEVKNLVKEIKQGAWAFYRPSLDILLSSTPPSRLQAGAVKLLLDEGADPNEKFVHMSVWERYLSALEQSPIPSEEESNTCKVIALLLEHGADPVFDRGETYFMDIMSTQFDVDRAASLEQLRLRQMKEKQKQQRLGISRIRMLLRLR